MIPTSYFTKTLYQETWLYPRDTHVDPADTNPSPPNGTPRIDLITFASTLRQRLQHHGASMNTRPKQAGA